MTVRMDSSVKASFDALCAQFGMSANTAMNIFAKAVVATRKIPFEIKAAEPQSVSQGMEAFMALRDEARKNGIQDMSLDEINEEIRQSRTEKDGRK